MYQDSCPSNFEDMLPGSAKKVDRLVYRVADFGVKDARSYLNSYDTLKLRRILYPHTKWMDLPVADPRSYSTSCSLLITDNIRTVMSHANRREPCAELARGYTKDCCGPSNIDSDGVHVNWWIYKDAEPYKYFFKVINYE